MATALTSIRNVSTKDTANHGRPVPEMAQHTCQCRGSDRTRVGRTVDACGTNALQYILQLWSSTADVSTRSGVRNTDRAWGSSTGGAVGLVAPYGLSLPDMW
eukprot:3887017-Rhodomonas_salina.2